MVFEMNGSGEDALQEYAKAIEYAGGNAKKIKPIALPVSREQIFQIGKELTDPQDAAAWSYLYSTAARVGEAVGNPKTKRPGVTIKDLELNTDNEELIVRCYTEKNKRSPFRTLRLTWADPLEKKILTPFINYALDHKTAPQIFNITRNALAMRFRRKLSFPVEIIENLNDPANRTFRTIQDYHPSPHYARHSRLTHLAQRGMNPYQLQAWAGWSNLNMASTYVHFAQISLKGLFETK